MEEYKIITSESIVLTEAGLKIETIINDLINYHWKLDGKIKLHIIKGSSKPRIYNKYIYIATMTRIKKERNLQLINFK